MKRPGGIWRKRDPQISSIHRIVIESWRNETEETVHTAGLNVVIRQSHFSEGIKSVSLVLYLVSNQTCTFLYLDAARNCEMEILQSYSILFPILCPANVAPPPIVTGTTVTAPSSSQVPSLSRTGTKRSLSKFLLFVNKVQCLSYLFFEKAHWSPGQTHLGIILIQLPNNKSPI